MKGSFYATIKWHWYDGIRLLYTKKVQCWVIYVEPLTNSIKFYEKRKTHNYSNKKLTHREDIYEFNYFFLIHWVNVLISTTEFIDLPNNRIFSFDCGKRINLRSITIVKWKLLITILILFYFIFPIYSFI